MLPTGLTLTPRLGLTSPEHLTQIATLHNMFLDNPNAVVAAVERVLALL